ncbi:Ni/Fe hydrogenase subunit alpha [Thiohalobacter sp. COW1]|uniref:Coenzyme F420-reducing hydrogenase, alpha subunit n=1 Tax=Thiohalobacter thiocyanaticus TaxID=585455 RepID=A0A1Z4VSN5_9GAMM|nr:MULTISPECIES: nickel-dependent hydrogenase large subunit [Thiohalobacter]BAZ94651.1 coenzyme F420-reducing hydrogenase, alpha subunit [Thiohalobacter thiocyanaticus]BCO30281.1 Ni/Fe hydrogenase subunit alpha [Thiohalobacter sp. COW1]
MTESKKIAVKVPVLARVEGEGALDLAIENGAITELKLEIYEPPRLFEKFLEGCEAQSVIDRVARICGICPVAYQMSAVHAYEKAWGVEVAPWVRDMRRVLYCGEWIQSHALHIHLLAAPDFLGFESATAMARDYPEQVRRGLRLQGLGNELIALFGGRAVHPIGVRVGGFHHAPEAHKVAAMVGELTAARVEAEALLDWLFTLELPADEQDFVNVAMRHPQEYPMNAGRIVSSARHDLDPEDFERHFREFQAPHSTALHAHLDGRPYLVGPLARLNLNADQLPGELTQRLAAAGIELPSRNMYHSIIARAVELLYAIDEALRLLRDYHRPDKAYVESTPGPGTAAWVTEAPRGILWHRYRLDDRGRVQAVTIVPPTSQNQARIEEDLRLGLTRAGLDRDEEALRRQGEMIIRNYDPCISCATHFLRLSVRR